MYFVRNALCYHRMELSDSILLVGVGNEYRTDDGVGLCAVREIQRRRYPGVRILETSGEGTSLMEAWRGYDRVMIVDAICSGATRGAVHRIDVAARLIPRGMFRFSSHSFGVGEAIEMARELKLLPRVLLLYGIEGCQFDTGTGLSNDVVRSMPRLLRLIEGDIVRLTPGTRPPGGDQLHDATRSV